MDDACDGKDGSVLSRTEESQHVVLSTAPLREVRSGSDND